MDQLLYTPEQVASRIAQSRTTVYELMRTGQLASVRIGRSRRVTASALEAFVAGLEEASP